jgi:hypothetical protein
MNKIEVAGRIAKAQGQRKPALLAPGSGSVAGDAASSNLRGPSAAEVAAATAGLKPQPQPETRRRIPIEKWRWLGHREGAEAADRAKLAAWQQRKELVVRGDGVLGFAAPATATFAFPAQDWRLLARLRIRRAGDAAPAAKFP